MFLKNRNIISKMKRSKVIDYVALIHFFINVSYHIRVASLTLMALFKLKTEPSELDWLLVYDMTH